MSDAHKCPKCKLFIIGDYCFTCKINIRDNIDFFKDIFNEDFFKDEKDGLDGFNYFGENNG